MWYEEPSCLSGESSIQISCIQTLTSVILIQRVLSCHRSLCAPPSFSPKMVKYRLANWGENDATQSRLDDCVTTLKIELAKRIEWGIPYLSASQYRMDKP